MAKNCIKVISDRGGECLIMLHQIIGVNKTREGYASVVLTSGDSIPTRNSLAEVEQMINECDDVILNRKP